MKILVAGLGLGGRCHLRNLKALGDKAILLTSRKNCSEEGV
ncbi:MAG: hypothetical protein NTV38_10755 [Chloroflexi bacterium]|nr:hypothetical protein [Chloroflexota bacterium]